VSGDLPADSEICRDLIASDLRSLGLRPGQDLIVHSSLRKVGPLAGGPATLLAAIRDVVDNVTLVVPTQTTWNSLTSQAFRTATAGLDADARARYIAALPGFDQASTPSAGMGAFAEYVRTQPDAQRSAHPQSSFAALGPRAASAMSRHDLNCHLGERSPLGWLYDAGAAIALIGVGYSACTAFHLAEYLLPGELPLREYHCFVTSGGERRQCTFKDIDLVDDDFELVGAALDDFTWATAADEPHHGHVAMADAIWLPVRGAVDFARSWMEAHRRVKRDN
jgi:aminoglycoside 3-N-acetyltransferase